MTPMELFQLQEFGSTYESETLRNSKKMDLADVIVYVHDSSDTNSFSYISNLRVGYYSAWALLCPH
jgi:mitochondrial Rho GTPase 1